MTGDRDAYQLVDDGVKIMTTSRGITDTRVYDREGVIDRYGIPPELVPDFIGLKGDTSDNIPGVPGIGDKTAAELLQRFGSLEQVLDQHRRDQRRQAQAEPDRARRRRAPLQAAGDRQARHRGRPRRRRVRVRAARPVAAARRVPRVRAARAAAPARGGARLGRCRGSGPGGRARADRPLAAGLARRRRRLGQSEVAVAVRAPETPEGALFGDDPEWRFGAYTEDGGQLIIGTCPSPEELVVGRRSAPGDRARRQVAGAGARGARPRHRGRRLPARARPPRVSVPRAVRGARPGRRRRRRGRPRRPAGAGAGRLAARGDPRSRADGPAAGRRAADRARSCATMELAGVKLDTERLAEISARVKTEADQLEREIFELAGEEFTLGSPKQLEEVLFGKLGPVAQAARQDRLLDRRPRAAGDPRGARDHPQDRALAGADQARADLPRRACRCWSTRRSRLHTTFNQTAATTGRLSSNNPNLQNIPIRTALGREIRACFVAEPGCLLVSADYSQVELRLLAHIAGEDVLKEIFRRGEDVHTATACRVFGVTPDQIDPGMRSKAKMINYGIVYGLSAYGMADRLAHPAIRSRRVHPALPGRLPRGRPLHRGDDRAGHRARLRLDPVRSSPSGARAARAALGAAQAGRAVRRQHGHPGHRGRHHEGGDGPL